MGTPPKPPPLPPSGRAAKLAAPAQRTAGAHPTAQAPPAAAAAGSRQMPDQAAVPGAQPAKPSTAEIQRRKEDEKNKVQRPGPPDPQFRTFHLLFAGFARTTEGL